MSPSNVPPPSGAEHSAFQSTQSALTRPSFPGPAWAWPVLAALAAAGLVYVVTSSPAGHAPPRPAAPESTVSSEVEALQPAAAAPAANPAPTSEASAAAPSSSPSGAPAADVAAKDGAAPGTDATSAQASDDSQKAVASASPATKKAKRAAAHRSGRKRPARAN